MRILLIDDEESIRNCLRHYLERRGHTVLIYTKGEGAVEYAEKLCPDLTLTDHNLTPAGIKGIEVVAKLITLGRRAILMSGDPTIAGQAYDTGVPFVEKTAIRDIIHKIEEGVLC